MSESYNETAAALSAGPNSSRYDAEAAWREMAEAYKASMKVFRIERDYARSALKTQHCIRPPNHINDPTYTVEQCISDGNCGCDCRLGMEGVLE